MRRVVFPIVMSAFLVACSAGEPSESAADGRSSSTGVTGDVGEDQAPPGLKEAGWLYGLNLPVRNGELVAEVVTQTQNRVIDFTPKAYLDEEGVVWTFDLTQVPLNLAAVSPIRGVPPIMDIEGNSPLFGVTEDGKVMHLFGARTHSLDGYPDPEGSVGELYGEGPIEVPGLENIRSVSYSANQVIAIDATGTAWGWGLNHEGLFGPEGSGVVGPGDSHETIVKPQPIAGLPPAQDVDFGFYGVLLAQDGTVWEWGNGLSEPRRVGGLANIVAILATDSDKHFALGHDGTLYEWRIDMSPQAVATMPAVPRAMSESSTSSNLFVVDESYQTWGWGEYLSRDLGAPGEFVLLEALDGAQRVEPNGGGAFFLAFGPPG